MKLCLCLILRNSASLRRSFPSQSCYWPDSKQCNKFVQLFLFSPTCFSSLLLPNFLRHWVSSFYDIIKAIKYGFLWNFFGVVSHIYTEVFFPQQACWLHGKSGRAKMWVITWLCCCWYLCLHHLPVQYPFHFPYTFTLVFYSSDEGWDGWGPVCLRVRASSSLWGHKYFILGP